jgi:hypothetical protein
VIAPYVRRALDRRLESGQLRIMNAPWGNVTGNAADWRPPAQAGGVVTTVGESVDDAPRSEPPRLERRN